MAEEETSGSFEVNGKRYSLPTDLTFGEMCDAERYFGVEFGSDLSASSMRMVAALVWVAVKREDASVTVEDIRDLPASTFESFLAAGDAGPPRSESSDDSEPSGESSANGGDRQEGSRIVTGSLGSDTGSDFAPLTSST